MNARFFSYIDFAYACFALLTAVTLALLFNACNPYTPPVPPPTVDASDASDPITVDASVTYVDANTSDASASCLQACAALTAAGCEEGKVPACPGAMQLLNDTKLMRAPDGTAVSCARVGQVKKPADAVAAGVGCTPTP